MFRYRILSVRSFQAWALLVLLGFAGLGAAETAPAPVPKTGQVVSHAAGDDGDLRPGVPLPVPRFVDNGNGTVSDRATGLVWLADPGQLSARNWSLAAAFCADLANGQAGLSDGSSAGQWRLPNRLEMLSLIDYGEHSPALPAGHPFPAAALSGGFWTGTSNPASPSLNAIFVGIGSGQMANLLKSVSLKFWPVRDPFEATAVVAPVPRTGAVDLAGYSEVAGEDAAVRAGVAWPNPRFTDLGNGTIRDNLTQLIWLKQANPFATRTWAQALAQCANLQNGQQGLSDGSVAGDWRLPSVREMQSLFSAGVSAPAIPNTAGTAAWTSGQPFTNVVIGNYWTGTTDVSTLDADAGVFTQAWSLQSFYGLAIQQSKGVLNFVWPVRGGQLGAPPVAPPTIVRQPVTQVVSVGDSVVFTVEAVANEGVLSYQWQRGTTVVGVNSPRLLLESVTTSDAGSYLVSVSNSAGTVQSFSATLTVVPAPPDNGGRAPVAQSGQTTSFASGDDGDLETGVAAPNPRFVDQGNGTVLDRLTGLVWLQNPRAFTAKTWREALDACSSLANGSAGLSDCSVLGQWRLPNREELLSLYHFHTGFPNGFPAVGGVTNASYWTSTLFSTYARSPRFDPMALYLTFLPEAPMGRGIITTERHDVWPVRAATALAEQPPAPVRRTGARDQPRYDEDGREDAITRRGVPWPQPRFTDHGDGTVRDNLTNLVWLKNADALGGLTTWASGLAACRALASGQLGLSDGSVAGQWRLPSIRELNSLVSSGWAGAQPGMTSEDILPDTPLTALPNTQGTDPWSPGDPFVNVRAGLYASSTAFGNNSNFFKAIDVSSSLITGGFKIANVAGNAEPTLAYIWPVRDGGPIDNQPPTIASTALNAFTIAPGATVGLSVVASDDGQPAVPGGLSYTWSVVLGGAAGVSFGPGNGTSAGANLSATVSNAGTYVFRVSVSDGEFTATATTSELLVTSSTSPGVIAFAAPAAVSQPEGDAGSAPVVLQVTRSGGSAGAVSASWSIAGSTATAGDDYIHGSGTVNWADGDSSPKQITVSILGDTIHEPDESFTVTLTAPTAGATLGFLNTATVMIANDDAVPTAGILSFNPIVITVAEGDSGTVEAVVTVVRQGGAAGAVSVVYSSSDGSAIAGSDYQAVSGTLNWANGEGGGKTFVVPVLGDTVAESDETLVLNLSTATGGAGIGAGAATVVILNDDAGVLVRSIAFAILQVGGFAPPLSIVLDPGQAGEQQADQGDASGVTFTTTSEDDHVLVVQPSGGG